MKKITKKEEKQFGDGKGNIDIVALLFNRLSEAKAKTNDKYFREGRYDLVEFL